MRLLTAVCITFSLLFLAIPLDAFANPTVKMTTNHGDIVIALNPKAAPITVANFEKYVREGFYDGLIFHRVIDNFMIQGGGFDKSMNQKKTHPPIKNEANNKLPNKKYSIAMARTNDPNSATAQFFINTNNNTFLNYTAPTIQGWGYAVFGEVIKGFETVDKINKVKTGYSASMADVPAEQVVIIKAEMTN